MTSWTNDELDKIGKAEELEIAARRPDSTLRTRTTIWVVRVGDDLFVRSAYGRTSKWFQGVQARHAGGFGQVVLRKTFDLSKSKWRTISTNRLMLPTTTSTDAMPKASSTVSQVPKRDPRPSGLYRFHQSTNSITRTER